MGPDPLVVGGSAEGISVRVTQRFELHPPTCQDGNFHATPPGAAEQNAAADRAGILVFHGSSSPSRPGC
jgi:hypothetical protein